MRVMRSPSSGTGSDSTINLLQRVDFVMKGGIVYKQDGVPAE